MVLEIPDRQLFIKGWSIELCSPEELDLGNNTEGWRVMDMEFAGGYSGTKITMHSIDHITANVIISEIVRHDDRNFSLIE